MDNLSLNSRLVENIYLNLKDRFPLLAADLSDEDWDVIHLQIAQAVEEVNGKEA